MDHEDEIFPPAFANDPVELTPNDVVMIMSCFRTFHEKITAMVAADLPEEPFNAWVRFASNPQLFMIMVQAVPTIATTTHENISDCGSDRFRQRLMDENILHEIAQPRVQSTAFLRKKLLLEHLFPSELHVPLNHLLQFLDAPLEENGILRYIPNTANAVNHQNTPLPDVDTLALADRIFMILSSIYVASGNQSVRIREAFNAFDREYRAYRTRMATDSEDGTEKPKLSSR